MISSNGLRAALKEHGGSMKKLTVLAPQRDPFRLDTPAGHTNGAWFADKVGALGLTDTIHLRGVHYAILGKPKPNGKPYENNEPDWEWLENTVAKAARWLGYVPFDAIHDARNAPPIVRVFDRPAPSAWVELGVEVEIPEEFEPRVSVAGFSGVQPYKLVLFGEKSSLEPVLGPIAERYRADLYLPTGEASDTMIHQMARIGAADGRKTIVFYFSDCDPSGYQMPISVARKLQAFTLSKYQDLAFELHRVALTPDHVREHGLPSSPLKETEKRAELWIERMGVEQTEIDALATLNPELLQTLAHQAIAPFFDKTLAGRVKTARDEWLEQAQAALEEQIDQGQMDRLRTEAREKLETLREEIDAINEALRLEVGEDDFEFPPMNIPEPLIAGERNGKPLIDSDWSFVEQTEILIAAKQYR